MVNSNGLGRLNRFQDFNLCFTDRNDVQITSSQDGSQATKYTLSWSVDDFYGDIPVKAFNLKFRKVCVYRED